MNRNISRRTFLTGAVIAPALSLIGCGGGGASMGANPIIGAKSVVRSITDLAHASVMALKPNPPVTARMHAIISTCMFDAWAAYDATAVGTQLKGTLRRPAVERTDVNKQKAIAFAGYRALVDLYPSRKSTFDAAMVALGYDPTDASTDTATPSGIGNTVAAAVIAFRHSDGSNQLGDLHAGAYSDYNGYVAKNAPDTNNPATNVVADPDHWQPLLVANGNGGFAIQPFAGASWFKVTPFAMTSGSQFRRTEVLSKYGSPEFLAKCQNVIDRSAGLTDLEKLNTEYWADGPGSVNPPGHMMLLADFVSARDNYSLDQDVKLFFLVGNAVLDAGIACWDTKRAYDSIRPLTAIHLAFKGKTIRAWGGPGVGTVSVQGENFGTFQSLTFVTPAFPGFCSGHSTYTAAASEVMKRFTGGDNLGFSVNFNTGSSTLEPGLVPSAPLTLAFPTFSGLAQTVADSRVTGGIHFVEDNTAGIEMGLQVGGIVWTKAQTYLNGTA